MVLSTLIYLQGSPAQIILYKTENVYRIKLRAWTFKLMYWISEKLLDITLKGALEKTLKDKEIQLLDNLFTLLLITFFKNWEQLSFVNYTLCAYTTSEIPPSSTGKEMLISKT